MIYVRKGKKKFPFSKGILSKSIARTGLSVYESYDIVNKIYKELKMSKRDEITPKELEKQITQELLERGHKIQERYYLMRSHIKHMKKPLFILIGGASGVGKSTISSEIGHRLGINRVINTDTIREIMRAIISEELIPVLHKSSFMAYDSVRTPLVKNKTIYAFEHQVSLINEGLFAVLNRGRKEGLNMVLNGVHIVPGFLEERLKNISAHIFQYIIDVPNLEQHIQHFYSREEGSLRSPQRYVDSIDRIREIQKYIINLAKKNNVKIIKNLKIERTPEIILEDIMGSLEES